MNYRYSLWPKKHVPKASQHAGANGAIPCQTLIPYLMKKWNWKTHNRHFVDLIFRKIIPFLRCFYTRVLPLYIHPLSFLLPHIKSPIYPSLSHPANPASIAFVTGFYNLTLCIHLPIYQPIFIMKKRSLYI